MANINSDTTITLEQIDALYTRIYNLKNTHKNSSHQINASGITLGSQTSGLSKGSTIQTNPISTLKDELKNLANSKCYKSSTADTVVQMTDFSGSIIVPSTGSVITAKDFNLVETAITSAEAITPSYASKYGSQYGYNYTSDYFSQYGYNYRNQYRTNYGTNYRNQYSSNYRSRASYVYYSIN